MRIRSHPDRSTPRRLIAVVTAGALALGGAAFVAAPARAADEPVEINLVTVNDFHGRIEASSPPAIPGVLGGVAALAQAVNQIRTANPNTVFAAAGDLIGASTFTSFIQEDVPTIEGLNAAGLEVSAAGNHEFDKGWDDLRGRVQDLADWEYIAANVYEQSTGTPALAESWVKEMDGIKVGFIGAVTEELPALVSPAGIEGLEVRDIVDSVNAVADTLTDGVATTDNLEADVLVLLIHEGAGNTSEAAATDASTPFGWIVNNVTPKVNAIVSGHTHLAYNHEVAYAGDTGLRPVISSGQYGEKFSNMVIKVDPATKQVLSMDNATIDMWWDHDANPATATVPRYTVPADDPIAALVAQAKATADIEGAVPLGTITGDLNRAKQASGAENRGGESTLGNFVADAQLWSAKRTDADTQIAFMNPGGLRADMTVSPDGILTYKEAAEVQSFANTLVTMDLTGDQIRAVLEQQWQPATASRPFLKLGLSEGFEYVYDPAAPAGSRILGMTLDGLDIDPLGSYRVVANSFLASGGDNFFALGQGTDKRDTGQVDLESMVAYMAEIKVAAPDYAQRSIGVTLPAAGASGYEVGSTFDVALSSLDFSTTEPRVQTVDVALGGEAAGSGAVSPSIPAAHADGSGTATVAVTVPEGITGDAPSGTPVVVPLTVTTTQGTEIEIPVTVFDRADSVTIGFPNKLIAKAKAAIQFRTIVLAEDGVPVTGEITIYDGGKAIATATLDPEDGGTVKVKLPALSKGVHKLSVSYAGSDTVSPSKSPTVPVLVW
ncbi:5'-nucleotidase C-terminal domain-containing protein [Microbacterium sp. CFBP9034]|uniref:5'-nucleotidase C-terminal domain-containing protein n=1 Tax=Microbacterium sp. CFBP9034 TaxID=3096540 RepID=UPI002A698FAC|nr:5'-nucleotidase C-terminal domain-containing protein [Microbacterium sp. CFBP9034]MDY0909920.1 5'-nucleotidase C-terminal domain-containing protein [Microbacterium sp. CFBP9034]